MSDSFLAGFFRRNAACSCGEQAYNIHGGKCGWCGKDVRSEPDLSEVWMGLLPSPGMPGAQEDER